MHMCVENEVVRWKFILEDRMFQVRMEDILFERVAWWKGGNAGEVAFLGTGGSAGWRELAQRSPQLRSLIFLDSKLFEHLNKLFILNKIYNELMEIFVQRAVYLGVIFLPYFV